MNRFVSWVLRNELRTLKLKRDETFVVCIREDLTQDELEEFTDTMTEKLGDKVVFIGGVDKVLIA